MRPPAACLIAILALLCWRCGTAGDRPVTLLTIATGGTGGVYYPLGGALAQIYTREIPGMVASAQATVASVFNVQALEQGKVDVAFAQGDVAHVAYTTGTDTIQTAHRNLRGMAVLYTNTVQIVVREDSDIRTVADLRGRRVGVGAPGSGTEVAARIIVEAHGLQYDDVLVDYLSFTEVAAQMQDRTLDAGFVSASYPVAAITDAATSMGIRLLPVTPDTVARIREEYPFLKAVVIPKGTYRGMDEDLPTIGMDNVLACRAGLPDDLVYQLTRVLFESLSELAETHAAARRISIEEAPNTSIPLHPGAARYYQEVAKRSSGLRLEVVEEDGRIAWSAPVAAGEAFDVAFTHSVERCRWTHHYVASPQRALWQKGSTFPCGYEVSPPLALGELRMMNWRPAAITLRHRGEEWPIGRWIGDYEPFIVRIR